MKSKLIFYSLSMLVPFLIGFYIINKVENNFYFLYFILFYGLIYRPIIDFLRLKAKGENVRLILFFVPFYSLKWFSKIYN